MKKLFLFILALTFSFQVFCQSSWSSIPQFGGVARVNAISFVINGKAYVGTGVVNPVLSDLWEYDPSSGWSQKTSMPITTGGAISFVINNKAYIGFGETGQTGVYRNEMYEYDPALDSWTQKTSCPCRPRAYASAFELGGKGYVGMGVTDSANASNDFWEYDPIGDNWVQKVDAPFSAGISQGNSHAFNFVYGGKGYVWGGFSNQNTQWSNSYKYDPGQNLWTVTGPNFISSIVAPRADGTCFIIGHKLYVGTGYMGVPFQMSHDFYEYDFYTGATKQIDDLPSNITIGSSSFVVGQNGYVGLGYNVGKNFWVMTSCISTIYQHPQSIAVLEGANATFNIIVDSLSNHTYQWQLNDGSGFVDLSNSINYANVNTPTLNILNTPSTFNLNQYRCNVLDSNSCNMSSFPATIFVTPNGIEENELASLRLISNLVVNEIKFAGMAKSNYRFKIYNSLGNEISNGDFTENRIQLPEVDAGIYFINIITSNSKSRIFRIIKI